MIYFHRNDVSKGTDVNKTNEAKESHTCHYRYFLNYSSKFQPNVYNRYCYFKHYIKVLIIAVLLV